LHPKNLLCNKNKAVDETALFLRIRL